MPLADAWIGVLAENHHLPLGVLHQLECPKTWSVGGYSASTNVLPRGTCGRRPVHVPNSGRRHCTQSIPISRFRLGTVMILSPAMP